jgi:hypothetical protein
MRRAIIESNKDASIILKIESVGCVASFIKFIIRGVELLCVRGVEKHPIRFMTLPQCNTLHGMGF